MQDITFYIIALATLMSSTGGSPLGDTSQEQCYKVTTEQKLHEPNCEVVMYQVDACSGKCNSWYIPRFQGSPIQICRACIASGSVIKEIDLKCLENGVEVKKSKMVVVGFTKCECVQVNCKGRR